jgi:hypothetical protein
MLWLTSGHDVPLEAARSDHRFTVASMTSRQAGRMWVELAWPRLPGSMCHEVPCAASDEQVYAGRSVDTARIARTNGRCAVWPVCGSYQAPAAQDLTGAGVNGERQQLRADRSDVVRLGVAPPGGKRSRDG